MRVATADSSTVSSHTGHKRPLSSAGVSLRGEPQGHGSRAVARSPTGAPSKRERAAAGHARRSRYRASRQKALPEAELVALFSNMATLMSSGVPLLKALEALAGDDSFEKAAAILEKLIQDVRSGSAFSTALSKHPESFSPMVISLMRAGEAGSALVEALERVAESLEKRRETISQIRGALTYPAIVTVLGFGAVAFLMFFVIPVFQETYTKAGMPLPGITQALIATSAFLSATWWALALLLVVAVSLYAHYRKHPKVRFMKDRLLLRLPVLGPVIRSVLVGRFVQTFGSLLAAGVSIKESLALTERAVGHSEYAGLVQQLRLAVARGEGLSAKLSEYGSLFPPLLTQMMILGEKSGDLGHMVMQIGRYIDKDLKRRTGRLSTLVEPIVTVAMALMIGTIAMAVYLPIFDMYKQIR